MKKYLIITLSAAIMLLSFGYVFAAKPIFQAVDVINPHTGQVKNTVTVPPQATEVAPGLYYLGQTVDNGKVVEGYAKIHYKKGYARPVCGNGFCEPGENANKCPADCSDGGGDTTDTASCYGYLAKGAVWKTIEPYVVNPSNTEGLDPNYVFDNLAADIGKWETEANYNILGDGSMTSSTLTADMLTTDGLNEVYFGDIAEPGAIGVTVIWGIFGVPPKFRELVEWDQIYDQNDFDWSNDEDPLKMDFESIATHELGHSVGMGDLYTSECSEMTMYGYASEGETKKRSLEAGDINGIKGLY